MVEFQADYLFWTHSSVFRSSSIFNNRELNAQINNPAPRSGFNMNIPTLYVWCLTLVFFITIN